MRRHTRTVRRKRFLEVLGERDAVGSALPGLACGVLGLAVAVFGATLGRGSHASAPAAGESVALAASASVSSASSGGAP